MTQRTAIVPEWAIRSGHNTTGTEIAKGKIVKLTAEDLIALGAASTDNLFGVTLERIPTGSWGDVQIAGKAIAYSGAALTTVGTKLTTDSTGRAVAATVSAGTTIGLIGMQVSTTAGADEEVEIELMPQGVGFTGSNSVADRTALKAIAAANRWAGLLVLVVSDNSLWRFHATSTAADTSENLVCTPGAGSGRWLRADKHITMALAFTYATADAAVLFTAPTGARVKPVGLLWDIDTSMTGGTASAIGVSSGTLSGYTTKGDLLGAAAGDVAATLVSTGAPFKAGTIGAKFDSLAERDACVLEATDTIRYDQITSAFTAGAGNVIVIAEVLANAGA